MRIGQTSLLDTGLRKQKASFYDLRSLSELKLCTRLALFAGARVKRILSVVSVAHIRYLHYAVVLA